MFTLLLTAVLATWQAVQIWKSSELMATPRAWAEACYPAWWARLLGCPHCLSVWVGAVMVLWLSLPAVMLSPGQALVAAWPVYALAVSRAANTLHDLTKPAATGDDEPEPDGAPLEPPQDAKGIDDRIEQEQVRQEQHTQIEQLAGHTPVPDLCDVCGCSVLPVVGGQRCPDCGTMVLKRG